MDQYKTLAIGTTGDVLTVELNRPEKHNALNAMMLAELTHVFDECADRFRVVILSGSGPSFCAGADLEMMRSAADANFQENVSSATDIWNLMQAVERCTRPIIARVNGAVFGGGVGLVACCDIVVATNRSRFAFSETRLGIVPAVITPFVLNKAHLSQIQELILTGEVFTAEKARQIGLVHHVVTENELDALISERTEQLLKAAPGAQKAAKELLRVVSRQQTSVHSQYVTELIAGQRESAEGKEGMSAFLSKRRPNWQVE